MEWSVNQTTTFALSRTIHIIQGSYSSLKSSKVPEFCSVIFQDWKHPGKRGIFWQVLECSGGGNYCKIQKDVLKIQIAWQCAFGVWKIFRGPVGKEYEPWLMHCMLAQNHSQSTANYTYTDKPWLGLTSTSELFNAVMTPTYQFFLVNYWLQVIFLLSWWYIHVLHIKTILVN